MHALRASKLIPKLNYRLTHPLSRVKHIQLFQHKFARAEAAAPALLQRNAAPSAGDAATDKGVLAARRAQSRCPMRSRLVSM